MFVIMTKKKLRERIQEARDIGISVGWKNCKHYLDIDNNNRGMILGVPKIYLEAFNGKDN